MTARTLAFVAMMLAVIVAGLLLAANQTPEPAPPAPPKWDEIPVCLYDCGSVPA